MGLGFPLYFHNFASLIISISFKSNSKYSYIYASETWVKSKFGNLLISGISSNIYFSKNLIRYLVELYKKYILLSDKNLYKAFKKVKLPKKTNLSLEHIPQLPDMSRNGNPKTL